MTDDEIEEFRKSERERMRPMREAANKEAFVQGWMWGKFGRPGNQSDAVLLDALDDAYAAYAEYRKHRTGP